MVIQIWGLTLAMPPWLSSYRKIGNISPLEEFKFWSLTTEVAYMKYVKRVAYMQYQLNALHQEKNIVYNSFHFSKKACFPQLYSLFSDLIKAQ